MRITRRGFLQSTAAAGAGLLTGAGFYGFRYGRHDLQLIRASVAIKGLPASLDGLRIGLMTDIHRGRWVSDDDVRLASAQLMASQPDLILLGGDYVTEADRKYIAPAAEALSHLHAPHGVFAVLGNHDDDRAVPAALQARGIEVLRDTHTRRRIRNEHLDLAGIRYWTRRPRDIASAVHGVTGPVILLAHDPRRILEATALDIPLVLSGHTHGGQVVLPGVGAIAARRFPTVSGFAQRKGTTLFVSRGVGTVYVPIRLNCPPDIAVLTLRAVPAGASTRSTPVDEATPVETPSPVEHNANRSWI
jgi:uncharacterized protein